MSLTRSGRRSRLSLRLTRQLTWRSRRRFGVWQRLQATAAWAPSSG